MFNSVGRKIQTMAKFICGLGIGISVLSGLGTMIAASNARNAGAGILVGIAVIALGTLVSWASTVVLYGFGELIENVRSIAQSMEKTERQSQHL